MRHSLQQGASSLLKGVAMPGVFTEKFSIAKDDFTTAGEASAKIKEILKRIGVDPALMRRVTISSYEAEMNIIIHSLGGSMTLEITKDCIRLLCKDTGPGIPSIEQAMKEGFSTAPENIRMMGFGAGMGLPNIKKNSDDFDISSSKSGTSLILNFYIK